MRTWRALKAQGAALLRDGVYLLPEGEDRRAALLAVAQGIRASGGVAHLMQAEAPAGADFAALFDRTTEHAELMASVAASHAQLSPATLPDVLKQARRHRKNLVQLAAVDFFPGEALRQVEAAVAKLEAVLQALQSPGEPHALAGSIQPLEITQFQGRLWATRARPWVDRLACAWLIRRFIDPQARFVWLHDPARCPKKALGFDFEGARFSHVGARVSFETLLASFGLETPSLLRVGELVHHLDVGGVCPPEAPGVAQVMAGMRAAITDDDQLLAVAGSVFEGLWTAYERTAA